MSRALRAARGFLRAFRELGGVRVRRGRLESEVRPELPMDSEGATGTAIGGCHGGPVGRIPLPHESEGRA